MIVDRVIWCFLTLNFDCGICKNVRVIDTEIYVRCWVLSPECKNTIHICIESFIHIVANQLWNLRCGCQIRRRKSRIYHFFRIKSKQYRIYKKLCNVKLNLVLRTLNTCWKLISILLRIRGWLHLESCIYRNLNVTIFHNRWRCCEKAFQIPVTILNFNLLRNELENFFQDLIGFGCHKLLIYNRAESISNYGC